MTVHFYNLSFKGSGRAADILAYAYQNSIGEEIGATDQEGKTKKMLVNWNSKICSSYHYFLMNM